MTDEGQAGERHARVREVFLAACERPVAERPAFLDEACGDDPLRREVEALLAHHQDLSSAETVRLERPPESHSRSRFETGHVFAGRYRIVSELGRGGMGQVFRAHDLVLDEPVAIKFLPPSRRFLEPLLNEVRMARQVTHPNVCRVFDFGEADGETFLTMEYLDGENLGSLLARIGRLQRDKLLDLARQLASGLAAAHARGVLHRDLKPANIMIDGRGQARITDFGIASSVALAATPSDVRVVAGTPAYMAPELASGGQPSVQSDLYALGLVLHEMATGLPVFRSETPSGYVDLHRTATPAPPSHQVAHLDPQIEAVIVQCLEKDPRDRPASARAVAAALPGGDRLRLALEAGETPSPELVAAAGKDEALGRGTAAALLAALLLLLAGDLALGDRAYTGRQRWSSKPPEVLVERAAVILRGLGYREAPGDRAWGFAPGIDEAGEEAELFWYRQSPSHLIPSHLAVIGYPRVDFEDPPPLEEGMIRVLLDTEGRLVLLEAVPEIAEAGDPDAEPGEVDWGAALRAAGFGDAALESAETEAVPPVFADERASWTVPEDRTDRIAAAAHRGRVVYFDAQPSEDDDGAQTALDFSSLWDWYVLFSELFWFLLVGAAVFLARINLKAGRGDLRSARRLAFFVAVMNLAAWLLAADHVPDLGAAFRLEAALGGVLFQALIVWLAYIALEPTVRRWWPRALIAWTRLLRGRVKDPIVGRSLLIGALAGTIWALATLLDRLATRWLGFEGAGEIFILPQLEVALSGRLMLASVLTDCVEAAAWGVFGLFFLVALRVAFKRWWVAVTVFVGVNGVLETLEGVHPAVSWLTLGVGIAAVTAFVLMRFGLLAYAVALFCYYVLVTAPVTLNFDAWFAETGLFVLALVAGIGLFGFWTALAGRPFASALIEPQLLGDSTGRRR